MRGLSIEFPQVIVKTALLGEEASLLRAASYWKDKSISLQT